jgi:hypothetical protein
MLAIQNAIYLIIFIGILLYVTEGDLTGLDFRCIQTFGFSCVCMKNGSINNAGTTDLLNRRN